MKSLQFVALVLTALALVPGGAHLFALPTKIHLSESSYFVAQTIYHLRGQWEVSHAVNAVITFVGFCSLTISTLLARE